MARIVDWNKLNPGILYYAETVGVDSLLPVTYVGRYKQNVFLFTYRDQILGDYMIELRDDENRRLWLGRPSNNERKV